VNTVEGSGGTHPPQYQPVAVSDESTVVAEHIAQPGGATAYQSEAELEQAFIAHLVEQGYEYLPVTSSAGLEQNLRHRLEVLNSITFSDTEWQRFFGECVAGRNDGIVEKTARVQEDHVQVLKRDDGTTKNVYLLDKQDVHRNHLQVLNQYEVVGAKSNRYDVTILVNGLPLVHVELKRRGMDIREAFNQINRYQRDSFWADSGLFEYVQLFVISNGTLTKYYSNTTRDQYVAEQTGAKRSKRKTSNSFEFTSWWADATNKPVQELTAFTRTFFARHTLLNVLTRYCVFDVDRKLLVMRPYQIVATEQILRRIETATTYKQYGTVQGGGYIWHTTGSGKTLTSFKAAQLASKLPQVEKVLFVVDRKDLDYQTMSEYERFEKGAVNSSKNTAVLAGQLADPNARIIVTTIQKLSRFIAQNASHAIYDAHVVVIFDECHRSQFGEMHRQITRAFKRYHLFGFTGTPIFAANAPKGGGPLVRTTEQAFGDKLHTYTIVDAINDKNVLPFRIDYINTIKAAADVADTPVAAIDTEKVLLAPERIGQVVSYILDHYDQKTKRTSRYQHGSGWVAGFNSMLATQSIDAARRYYTALDAEQEARKAADPTYRPLKIAVIFTYGANEEVEDFFDAEDPAQSQGSEQFLKDAIDDYNALFATSYDTSADGLQNYYKDVSARLKSRELDMVIVVNMFLTGFDATTLNTLWVDKNLRQHGLIQAYSRTNRILNRVKSYGNIVSFRNLEEQTNDALALFGNKDAKGIVLLHPYAEYRDEYQQRIDELLERFPVDEPIVGEAAQKAFIALFGAILRLRNILTAFDEFAGDDPLSPRALQDYQGRYLDLYADFRSANEVEKESINDDVVFEIELIKQVEVNVDYVLMLVRKLLDEEGAGQAVEIRAQIDRAVDSSPSLRNKRDLIEQFVAGLTVDSTVDEEWRAFVRQKRDSDLDAIIAEEGLRPDQARDFVRDSFRDGAIPTTGTAITRIMPPTSRFTAAGDHGAKKQAVLERLALFFDRYFGLI
jgi:type I restriction enzyme R subunit